ncbi:MAG: hypothetical protein ACRDEA_11220, partial [Microcystaceae cyanobacterium]
MAIVLMQIYDVRIKTPLEKSANRLNSSEVRSASSRAAGSGIRQKAIGLLIGDPNQLGTPPLTVGF